MDRRSQVRALTSIVACLVVLGLSAGTWLTAQSRGGGDPRSPIVEQARQRLARFRAAISVHAWHADRLMQIADVVGSGVAAGSDGEPFIRVFTARRGVPGIPTALDGVEVRPEVSGRFYALRGPTCNSSGDNACTTAERWPLPVPIGVSVGHPSITAGTIGARVTNGTDVFALSNNHVMAAINGASLGDPIIQPGSYDGGTSPGDAIATLSSFEPIRFCTVFLFWIICNQTNTIDAAIARSTTGELGAATPLGEYGSVPGFGAPSSVLHPAYGNPTTIGDENLGQLLGTQVQKYGRTTGVTTGTVNTISATVDVCYDSNCVNVARFVDQLLVTPGTFSSGGDSGSLLVTTDGANRPVGLLFAGSSTTTIANRIDRVLSRFAVTVDEGGTPPAATIDVAITGIGTPGTVAAGAASLVTVTVENRGQQTASNFTVTLRDLTEAVQVGVNTVASLAPGSAATVDFSWTPTAIGVHTLEATHQLAGDENPANDTLTADVNVVQTGAGRPQLQLRRVQAYTDRWVTVQLDYDYGDDMVVVCSPNYDRSAPGPAIARVRNASGSAFEVGLGRPWYGAYDADHFSAIVHCVVVREGVYTVAEHGVKMEAVKVPGFAASDHAGAWSGQPRSYLNAGGYTRPVVVGQVVSPSTGLPPSYCPAPLNICEQDWSMFWSRGTAATNPPSSGALCVGRHTGEDTSGRAPETLVYVVIETGSGSIEGRAYTAALGADTVRGMSNKPPFTYTLSGLTSASTAVVSQAAMDANDGGWALLFGASAVSATQLRLAIDEDWFLYSERNHTTEQVAYIVFQ